MRYLLAILGFIAFVGTGHCQTYIGPVTRILEGDSFLIHPPTGEIAIRLCGIDAPKGGHPDGPLARRWLSAMIFGKTVVCKQVGNGTPCDGRSSPVNGSRIVAQCFFEMGGTGADVAREMVAMGFACDWPRHSNGCYYMSSPITCTRK